MTLNIYQVCMAEPDSTWGGVTHHLMLPSTACSRFEVAQTFRNNNNLSFLPFFLPSFPSFPNPSIQFWESLVFYCLRVCGDPHSGNLYLPSFLYQELINCLNTCIQRTFVILPQHQHSFCHLNPDLIPHPKLLFSCLSAHFNISGIQWSIFS